MELLRKTERFITDVFSKSDKKTDILHHQRTVYWIKQLKLDADEALCVAGMSHDIERAIYGDWKAGSDDLEKLKKHQEQSAFIIENFLIEQKAPKEFIERVKDLILNHEEGGTDDQNILCDADCLAFLEEKGIRNAKKAKQENKVDDYKKRLGYILNRLHLQKAKDIAQGYYDEILKELNS